MSWEMHEAAKKIADGWYSEFEATRKRNAVLGRENDKLRELLQRLLTEYRYMRVRPRAMYLQHEGRMRAIEEEMRELGVTADD